MGKYRIPNDCVLAIVVTLSDGRRQIGSGYLVSESTVLTARHCIRDILDSTDEGGPSAIHVQRLSDGAKAEVVSVINAGHLDLLVLKLSPIAYWARALQAVRFARIDRSSSETLSECIGVGFPLWQYSPAEKMRASGTLSGEIRTGDGLGSGLLQIRDLHTQGVSVPPESTNAPQHNRSESSPWGGFSGALIFHRGLALGVVVEHHPWRNAVILCPIDSIFAETSDEADIRSFAEALDLPSKDSLRLATNRVEHVQQAGRPLNAWTNSDEENSLLARVADFSRTRNLKEIVSLGVAKPSPMPVHWQLASQKLNDFYNSSFGTSSPEINVWSHEVSDLRDQFLELPRQRLVILGAPGSGKTVLANLLVGELLSSAQVTGKVPVLLALSSWDVGRFPALHDWIAQRLHQDFGFALEDKRTGRSRIMSVRRLVANGSIIPVLDGLDEVEETVQGRVLAALDEYLTGDDSLIITCRSIDYIRTVNSHHPLIAAAAVEALPLSRSDVSAYLKSLPRVFASSEFREVADAVSRPQSGPLADVLSSPLGLWLFRSVYLEKPFDSSNDPRHLLNSQEFADENQIRQNLYTGVIAAIVSTRVSVADLADPLRPQTAWQPDRVERWLREVALRQRGSDINWWKIFIYDGGPQVGQIRRLLAGSALSLQISTIVGIFLLCTGIIQVLQFLNGSDIFGLLVLPVVVLAATAGYLVRRIADSSEPSRLNLGSFRQHLWITTRSHGKLYWLGFTLVCFAFLAIGSLRKYTSLDYTTFVLLSAPVSPVLVFTFSLVFSLSSWIWPDGCECPVCQAEDMNLRTRNPIDAFFDSRSRTRRFLAVGSLLGALPATIGFTGWLIYLVHTDTGADYRQILLTFPSVGWWVLIFFVFLGMALLVVACVSIGAETAWFGFSVSTRLQAIRGKSPWRAMSFLEDCYRMGLLRASGAAYQFRHLGLRDYLLGEGKVASLTGHGLTSYTPAPLTSGAAMNLFNQNLNTEAEDLTELREASLVDPERNIASFANALFIAAKSAHRSTNFVAAASLLEEAKWVLSCGYDQNPKLYGEALSRSLMLLSILYEEIGDIERAHEVAAKATSTIFGSDVNVQSLFWSDSWCFSDGLQVLYRTSKDLQDRKNSIRIWEHMIGSIDDFGVKAKLHADLSTVLGDAGQLAESHEQLRLAFDRYREYLAAGADQLKCAWSEFLQIALQRHVRQEDELIRSSTRVRSLFKSGLSLFLNREASHETSCLNTILADLGDAVGLLEERNSYQ